MTDTFEYASRRSSASLSVLSIAGLGALAAILWQISPGYVLLLMIPALLLCLWQMSCIHTYGIQMSQSSWRILGGDDDLVIAADKIDHLRIMERGDRSRIGVMLVDGTEIVLPIDSLPDPLHLIREATARGIPVREIL